jgi:hypothetical protein
MANLREIWDLSEQYDALVMVDDSHATGFLGPDDRGTPADVGVDHWVGTLGKALGGVSGAERSGFDPLMPAEVLDGDPLGETPSMTMGIYWMPNSYSNG